MDIDQAQDVVMTAYEQAYKYRHTYDEEKGEFSKWFNKVLFNCLRSHQRDWKKRPDTEAYFESIEYDFDEDTSHLSVDRLEKLIKSSDLSQKHKSVLLMFYVLGLTASEVSQISGDVTVTNVTTICNRFKERLTNEG